MSEYASDIVSFSPGTTAQSNQDPIELVIRRRQGIVGVVPASTEPPWAQQFQMFAHRLDGTSPPVRDETWRYGLRTKAEPYTGDGVYFLLTDVPAGTYVVGIRYPDAVVRETTTVEVGEGLHKAKLAVSTPAEHEVLRLCCTDHLGRRADDMSFRLETMVRDSSAEDLHTIDDAIVHPSGLGHYEIDLRWLPRRFRLAGSHPGPDHAAWIHATSTDRGQRVLRLREALGRSAVPQVGGKPRATLRLAPTRSVDLQIMKTRGLSSYEVLAYMERSGVNGEGLGPIRDPFLRATAIPVDEKDIDRSTARIRLPESEPMTLVVREARPGVWLKPIDFVRRSMRIEPDPDCLPSSDRMQILVNAPPHRDLAVHVASARLRPVAIGLEAQMPDRRWRLIMAGHAADGSPLKVAALPHGAYRIKTYATGTYTTFELGPDESGPQIVTLSPTP